MKARIESIVLLFHEMTFAPNQKHELTEHVLRFEIFGGGGA